MSSPTESLAAIHAALSTLPEDIASLLGESRNPGIPEFDLPATQGLEAAAPAPMHPNLQAELDSSRMPDMPEASAAFPEFPEFGLPEAPEASFPETSAAGLDIDANAAFPMPATSMTSPTDANAPEFGDTAAAFPEFPAFATPEFPNASFPAFETAGLAGDVDAAFPSMPGFSEAASSFPAPPSAEYGTDGAMLRHLEEINRGIETLNKAGGPSQGFQRSNGPVQLGDVQRSRFSLDNGAGG